MFNRYDLFVCAILFLSSLNFSFPTPATLSEILTVNQNQNSVYRSNYASQMLSYMNHSVSPCDDFYEYACGNWKNVIEGHWTAKKRTNFLDITYKLNDIAENILKRPDINDVAPEYAAEFELAKKFYSNCMGAELFPMKASSEYLEVLEEIGGFPEVDTKWKSENFDWLNMSAHLSNYGVDSFVKEKIAAQYSYFEIPKFGFDIELHSDTIENSSSNAYKENEKRMQNILTIYGVTQNNINNIINEIFIFLKKILSVSTLFEDNNFCQGFSNLTEKLKIESKWRMYYDIAWQGKQSNHCCKPCFYMYYLIDKICENNKRAAANYLSLKFLFHMDARLQDKKHQKDFCISHVKTSMIYLFDHLYMKLYSNHEAHAEISYIIKDIRLSLRNMIEEAKWLDEPTRNAALLKESTMKQHIGRYEDTNYTKLLLDELRTLQYINGSYEGNNLNLCKFKQKMVRFNGLHLDKLGNTSKDLFFLVGLQNNAAYSHLDNSFYVFEGVLMEPVYNEAWPYSLKYAAIGSVIGHELIHGFDTIGANFDESANINNWWSNASRNAFNDRANCYVNHYQDYFVPEINRYINGELTKDENIADAGGLRAALMAYRHHISKISIRQASGTAIHDEEQMPGIDLSPEQLFFLGFAQQWCASYREADFWKYITDRHTIEKFRVLGALSNNDDFAEAYSCAVGSKMNSRNDKCKLW